MKRFYPKSVPSFPYEPSPEDFQIVRIGDSMGQGVVTRKAFKKGEIVCAFSGYVVDVITQFSLQISPKRHLHDPHFMGKVLHSCDPNLDCDMRRRLFIARRDIFPGEIITMDYAQTEDYLYKPFTCSCGAADCRGIIVGKREVAPSICAA